MPEDYGLLGGLAAGLNSGLDAYKDEQARQQKIQQLKEDRDARKQYQQGLLDDKNQAREISLFSAGAKQDPNSGGLIADPNNPNYQIKQSTAAKNEAEARAAVTKPQEKQSKEAEADMFKLQTQLESARGNPEVSQALKDRYAAKKARSLGTMYGDPNNMSNQQVNLLVSEVGKMASGGTPAMSELQALTPGALAGELSGAWSKLSNKPTAANAGQFVKQYMDYVDKIDKDANEVINNKFGRVLNSHMSKYANNPTYQSLREQYLPKEDPSGGLVGKESAPHGQKVIQNGKTFVWDPKQKDYVEAP